MIASFRPLRHLLVSGALLASLAYAQANLIKPGIQNTLSLNAYADNWCTIFINGKMVAVDAIDFLPHNQISIKILPEYPMTIAVLAKDNADPATGLEYGNKIGDGGFILKLGDGTITNGTWRAKCFFKGPLNSNVITPTVSHTPIPARWYEVDFDDSGWEFATEYTAARVGPDGDYVATDFTLAKFIWTSDLNLDNTVIFRQTVTKPANYVKTWNTTPDLKVSTLPQELIGTETSTGTIGGTNPETGQFVNLSTRAFVGTADGVLIPGLVIGGTTAKRVLVRAVGPTLAAFAVSGSLADPTLTLFRGTTALATNDNWQEQPESATVANAALASGAFALPNGSKDSAVVLTLAPGSYTFRVAGVGGTTGIALVEVYAVP
ncbi:MAG: hypothetical protein RL077_2116 [Verrucomicrobiota bacterium]